MKKGFKLIFLGLLLSILICGCSISADKTESTPEPAVTPQPIVTPTVEPINYNKYIGVWQDAADSTGRHYIGLTIYQIDGNTMDIEIYRLRGKSITYTVDNIKFTDDYTVNATGSYGFLPENSELAPASYEFILGDDTISLSIFTEYSGNNPESITLYKDPSAPAVTPRPANILRLEPGAPKQYGCKYHITEETAKALILIKFGENAELTSTGNTSFTFEGDNNIYRVDRWYQTDDINSVNIYSTPKVSG